MNIQILSFRHALYTFKRYLVCLQIGWVEFLLFISLIILKLLALFSQPIHLIFDIICVFCRSHFINKNYDLLPSLTMLAERMKVDLIRRNKVFDK